MSDTNTISFSNDATFAPEGISNTDSTKGLLWSKNRVTEDSSTDPFGSDADNIGWLNPTSSSFPSTPRVASITFSEGTTFDSIGTPQGTAIVKTTSGGTATFRIAYAGYFTSTAYPGHEFLVFQVVNRTDSTGDGSKLNIGYNYFTLITRNDSSDTTKIPDSIQAGDVAGTKTYYPSLPNFSAIIECYLKDTLIETAKGEVKIQDLKQDDLIAVYKGKEVSYSPLKKLRVNKIVVKNKDDLPIVIKKDALAQNVPSHDLYVTNEHAVLLNGKFFLARMLVNGTSIFVDHSFSTRKEYTTYHLELNHHSVVLANNVLSESYLDASKQVNEYLSVVGSQFISDMAAPLVTSQHEVKQVWDKLKERATSVFKNNKMNTPETIYETNPNLHLEYENGTSIAPIKKHDGQYVFIISRGVKKVTLVSRTFRPCDVEGPYLDDRRVLGVCVGEILLNNFNQIVDHNEHLQTKGKLKGWSAYEGPHGRWTTGAAEIHIADIMPDRKEGYVLTVKVLQTGKYLVSGNNKSLNEELKAS